MFSLRKWIFPSTTGWFLFSFYETIHNSVITFPFPLLPNFLHFECFLIKLTTLNFSSLSISHFCYSYWHPYFPSLINLFIQFPLLSSIISLLLISSRLLSSVISVHLLSSPLLSPFFSSRLVFSSLLSLYITPYFLISSLISSSPLIFSLLTYLLL